ncbi:helix-turn-helix domain-containing protein [Pseudomonas sp. GG8]
MQADKGTYKFNAMSTLAERVKLARAHARLTQKALASRVGVEQPVISQLETGKNLQSVHLSKIAHVCGVSSIWLSDNVGEMVDGNTADEDPAISREGSNVKPTFLRQRKSIPYPVISWVAAGSRAESPDNFNPGDADVWLVSDQNAGDCGYWLEVKGKSMTSDSSPSFLPGTFVLVQPEGFDLISGKYYIAKHMDGETTFKQYIYDAGAEYLAPLNPAYKTIELDADEWQVIGRVVDVKVTGL